MDYNTIKQRMQMPSETQAPTVDLTATPNTQLDALTKKKEDFTNQLETNNTKAANVARLGTADSFEGQKSAAMQAARAAGRPWTNADEAQWAARKNRTMTQQQNELTLGREKMLGDSINAQESTINSQISQQLQQKQQQLNAAELASSNAAREADRVAMQAYQAAQLKIEQQRLALQQSQQLQTQMYGQVTGQPSVTYGGGGASTYVAPRAQAQAVSTPQVDRYADQRAAQIAASNARNAAAYKGQSGRG